MIPNVPMDRLTLLFDAVALSTSVPYGQDKDLTMTNDPAATPLFTPTDAERIVGAPASTTRRWLEGYAFEHKGERRPMGPRLGTSATRIDGVLLMSFLDLVEVQMARIMRRQGISWPNIDRAAAFFREAWRNPHPFALQRFRSDSRSVFVELGSGLGENSLLQLGVDQFVFDALIEQSLFDVLDFREDGVPWRLWPHGRDARVVVDPARSFGQPILDDQGMPVRLIAAAYMANDNQIDRVARWFDVPADAVEAAIRYEGAVRLAA
jgi:uncharacterized protein (DUF433 family)